MDLGVDIIFNFLGVQFIDFNLFIFFDDSGDSEKLIDCFNDGIIVGTESYLEILEWTNGNFINVSILDIICTCCSFDSFETITLYGNIEATFIFF